MSHSSQQTALITGASTGIGYELAEVFARDHYNLVLVARSQKKLEKLAGNLERDYGIKTTVITQDLSVADGPQKIHDVLQKQGIEIDVLVNNAGFGNYGMFTETDWKTEAAMIQLNITSLTHLTKLFLPSMLKKGRGKIMNIASTAAFFPGPFMSVYYASKAYVLSFSQALSKELAGSGITVSVLCPGATKTEFSKVANMENARLFDSNLIIFMSAKEVAVQGYKGLMKNKSLVITGLANKLMIQSVRFIPRNLMLNILHWIMSKRIR
ncbi:MAG TPA: SDR family oxidoreductase [Calditrichaeota bacterium]|nr:SDR family oxidoreductase [Calditrichota bacterium]